MSKKVSGNLLGSAKKGRKMVKTLKPIQSSIMLVRTAVLFMKSSLQDSLMMDFENEGVPLGNDSLENSNKQL